MNDQVIESKKESSDSGFLVISPLDWAIAFATAKFGSALPIFFALVTVQAALVYLRFAESLSQNQYFIIGVAETLIVVWFITAIVYLSIASFKSERPNVLATTLSAFSQIPKVFFSYIFVLMVVGISLVSLQGMAVSSDVPPLLILFLALPLLILSAYLLWAPFFCAAEGIVVEKKETRDPDEELDEDEIIELAKKRFDYQFRQKLPWELGFARSIRLTSLNVSLTYTLVLLFATAYFFPLSIVSLLFQPGILRSIAEVVAVGGLNTFVLLVICGALLLLLAKEAKDELGIAYYVDPRTFFKNEKLPQAIFQGRKLPFVLLILLCGLSFGVVLQSTLQSNTVPKSLQVQVEKVIVSKGGFVTLTVDLKDQAQLFQWYRADGFKLGVGELKKEEVIEPLELLLLNSSGEASDEMVLAPRIKPIKVRIVFKVSKKLLEDELAWRLEFLDLFGGKAVLAHGVVVKDQR